MYDYTMLGGYAIKYDTATGGVQNDDYAYTTLNVLSGWTEFIYNLKKWQFGIFGGYTKNMGSLHNIFDWTKTASFYSRGRDISDIFRISPRVVFNAGKLRLALEGEYTSAAYGNKVNSLGDVSDLKRVANIRVLLGVYYFF
jgi:hypothetical protein